MTKKSLFTFVDTAGNALEWYDSEAQYEYYLEHWRDIAGGEEGPIVSKIYDTFERTEEYQCMGEYSIEKRTYKNFKDSLTDQEYWNLMEIFANEEVGFGCYTEDLYIKILDKKTATIQDLIKLCHEAVYEFEYQKEENTLLYRMGDTTVKAIADLLDEYHGEIFALATEKEKAELEKFLAKQH